MRLQNNMKLLLINPAPKRSNLSKRGFKIQPLNLAYVAAVTPSGWDVEILDENFQEVGIGENIDLVGITSMTATINRAYELASQFRKRNIPVVMGGIHVSMVPEEALNYADAVVIGEAEPIWHKVIEDFEKKSLQRVYKGDFANLETNHVLPRRDLLSSQYSFASIQTSRGCPFDCEFCSVSTFNGKIFRQRPVSQVLDEMEGIPNAAIAFIDDNLIGYSRESQKRAKELFQGMMDRGIRKKWGCQASINFAEDEHLIELAAKSGCCAVLMGIESIDPKVLSGHMNKKLNSSKGIDFYYTILERLHKYGIVLVGNMVFCNDEETLDIFPETTEFISKASVDIPWPGISTPNPGTSLYNRLLRENRLLFTNYPEDWSKYIATVPLKPKSCSLEIFYKAYHKFINKNFSYFKILVRAFKTLRYSKSLFKTFIVFNFNLSLKNRYKNNFCSPFQFLTDRNHEKEKNAQKL
jgi:radical SAM superfamily enzyme YgiQ (UPF0313 family)